MQLNFAGLLLVGLGIVALGLAISGNYKSFGQSLKTSLAAPTKGQPEPAKRPGEGGK